MQNLSKPSKIFLFLTELFFVLWLGGYVLRQIVVYQFFEPENLSLKLSIGSSSLSDILLIILPVFVFNIVTYAGFLVTFIVFLFISKISLKKEGWLFISVLIVAVCAPFEIYLLAKDYKIATTIYSMSFDPTAVMNEIRERLVTLSSFSLIEIVSFIGIIFLSVFQPLKRA